MMLPITGLYAALLGLVLIFLSYKVVKQRRGKTIGLGDGGDKDVLRAMRVHANFTEYVPLALILFALAEANGAWPAFLHIIGSALVLARLAHAEGFSKSSGLTKGRFYGTAGTWTIILILSIENVWLAFKALA